MPAACRPICGAPSAEIEPAVIALRVTRRPGATVPDETALPLPPKGLVIGRAVDCGLVLADPLRMVSRQHALVVAVGEGGRVRCVSSNAPLWVNVTQVAPGGELPLSVGDRLRLGGFELAVETAAAAAAPRARLDRWFDLDSVEDPLAAASPLPPLAPSVPAPSPSVPAPSPPPLASSPSPHAPCMPTSRNSVRLLRPAFPTRCCHARCSRGRSCSAASASRCSVTCTTSSTTTTCSSNCRCGSRRNSSSAPERAATAGATVGA